MNTHALFPQVPNRVNRPHCEIFKTHRISDPAKTGERMHGVTKLVESLPAGGYRSDCGFN
jgi:hypothetical protein